MNASVGEEPNSIRSDFISNKDLIGVGSSLIQRLHSAKRASNNWDAVGAVTTILTGYRVRRNQIINQDAQDDFPTPCPERILHLRSPFATADITSLCQSWGV